MKILQTCLSLSWGGMEMYTLHTAILLKNEGHEVELLCAANSRLQTEAEKEGIFCFSISIKLPGLGNIVKLAAKMRDANYDIVHSQASKDLWFLVPALYYNAKKIPLILTKHVGSGVIKKDLFHRILYKRVDLALAISEVIRKNLIETTPLSRDKIELLHDAIDVNRFDPEKTDNMKIRNEFNIRKDEIIIGMTGRFSPGKGHEEFLMAAKVLVRENENVRFMVVGEASRGEEKYENSIKEMAAIYGLSEKVIFTGFRSDIPDVLAAFDIFLFPSHAEAFGLALVEAMSMELPTVCSNSDGVIDIAVDGVTSFLFSKGEGETLIHQLETLINDSEKRKEFGKAGRARVINNFSYELYTKKLLEIYEKELEAKNLMPGL